MPRTAHAWREEGRTRVGFRAASRGIGVISGAGGRGVTAGQSLDGGDGQKSLGDRRRVTASLSFPGAS